MKLSEIFDQLSYGELAQVAIGGFGKSGILEDDYPKIISHVNLGLLDLFSKFDLKREEIFVQQYDHINLYELNSRYAQSNMDSPEAYKYIMDTEATPFVDNVLKIERILDECGRELYVNDRSKYWSLFTPSPTTIQVPWPEIENSMAVSYRAAHKKLDIEIEDPSEVEVNLPITHLPPLLYFIAARVHSTIPAEGQNNEQIFMGKYLQACQQITNLDLVPTENNTNCKLERNGWV